MISLPNPVIFMTQTKLIQITNVDFDFDDDYYGDLDESQLTDQDLEDGEKYKQKILDSVVGKVYEVQDEDEISDLISDETGWSVMSVDYIEVVESF